MHPKEQNKAVLLLSSGLDSSVNLVRALQDMEIALALTFHYGQRAALKEISAAQSLCQRYAVPHKVIDLSWFHDFSQSALNSNVNLPSHSPESLDDKEASEKSAKAVWVPNRNGIFLNIAAGYAEGLGAQFVIPGFNKEEASTFPDNSAEFLDALNGSFSFSTGNHVKVKCYTTALDKSDIVRLGLSLNLDFSKLWPCYENFEKWCGTCESCQRFSRALKKNKIQFEDLR